MNEMKPAIVGIVIISVTALVIVAIVQDASARGACIALAAGGAGSLGGYVTAHKKGDSP